MFKHVIPVWRSLKFTTTRDRLNKIKLPQEKWNCYYEGDPHTKLGVHGMVDDNLATAKCGNSSMLKIQS